MAIQVPSKVLLRKIPLKFVRDRVAGGGRKSVDMQLPLVPFIDFLIVLVVFLIMNFATAGGAQPNAAITMPSAANTEVLEVAPVIAIDRRVVTVDGVRVADTQTLDMETELERIEGLYQYLEQSRENWSVLHPHEPFPAAVVIQADVRVDFRVIKKVMYTASQSGHQNVSFAVNGPAGGPTPP
ncbi:MAG: biopolymer transport protein ExbD [Polyangiales bacterium]|jgi:biopolymer transport protein ExbD